ncbi:ATPase, T2SS/T4P/T4SS family [Sphaerotilus microaerophilus]|uniref:Type IV-A pilus assembly ATPase PilB n=1 Tax=Sphaerotilus microaerophilus TaxID=2914710 RepID=A0ABN6PLL7_9BURK|nr:ATPase, T2SS/T4P/T4SS family [Sphaerotilus sp. FB-5]BDI04690.1 type IV-A pilus assembly ATPase PilB [Sphaerotilus sp. FB-5]
MDEVVTRSRVGALTYLSPGGALVEEAALAALQGAIAASTAAGQLQLVLDLGRVTVVNGRALELLLDASARLATHGGRLQIINPTELVRDILLITGLDQQLAVARLDFGGSEPVHAGGARRHRRLGEILMRQAGVSADELEDAERAQLETGQRVGQILVGRGRITEVVLQQALAEQLGVPYLPLRPGLFDAAALALLPRETARRLKVMPLFKVGGTLTLATADAQAVPAFDEVRRLTKCTVRVLLTRAGDIDKYLSEAYTGGDYGADLLDDRDADLELVDSGIPDDYTTIDEMAGASPVINLVNSLIQRAIRDKASDIHIEVQRGRSRVRFRIDGVLYEVMTPRAELHPAIVSRLKVMASLDIAERRLPQDGRIQVSTQGRTVDLRFSSLPGIHGEKVVLRVLDKNQSILDVAKLGMAEANLATFKGLLGRSNGLILVTGPTGSGKTTTLYAAVNYLKSMETNIVTIEDPVEYQLDIINQNQVNEAIGLGFARMLKHVLRQDPDVVMVGEIRDRQTAEIAVQAALTGHLVLSTLHTNDAVGALSRLTDMGVEPYLLASALAGVVAQRLVRHVCPSCKTRFLAPPELVARHGWPKEPPVRLVKGRGCASCYDSGYKGRLGIHELLVADERLQGLIARGASREELLAQARHAGLRTLHDDGVQRALEGRTTLEEVGRAVHAS